MLIFSTRLSVRVIEGVRLIGGPLNRGFAAQSNPEADNLGTRESVNLKGSQHCRPFLWVHMYMYVYA